MGPVLEIPVPWIVLLPIAFVIGFVAATYFGPIWSWLSGGQLHQQAVRRAPERVERFTKHRTITGEVRAEPEPEPFRPALEAHAHEPVPDNVRTMIPRAAGARQRRQLVIEEVARHPEWSSEEIFAAGMRAGLWDPDGGYADNRERNRRRAARLRWSAAEWLASRQPWERRAA